jgi:hypothetical protein
VTAAATAALGAVDAIDPQHAIAGVLVLLAVWPVISVRQRIPKAEAVYERISHDAIEKRLSEAPPPPSAES